MKLKLRSMCVAESGKALIACDLSQAESWVVAYLANEPNMKHSLQYGDIHTETAGNALFFGDIGTHGHTWVKMPDGGYKCPECNSEVTKEMRYIGKRFNHASAYGMGHDRAAQVINKDSDKPPYVTVTTKQSKEYQDKWHAYYLIKNWWLEIQGELDRTRQLRTPYGRIRTFYAQWGSELFKEAYAYKPQSSVADHFNGMVQPELGIEGGLLTVYKKIVKPNLTSIRLNNQSHDSLIMEVPKANVAEIAQETMQYLHRPMLVNGEMFSIPVDCEIGERWGELEEYGKMQEGQFKLKRAA